MKKLLLSAAVVAVSTAATPAFAQENLPFTGPWVGATAGYDKFTTGDEDDDGSEDGIAYGIALGYDVNLGGVLIGAEAELTDNGVSATAFDVLEDDDELTLSAGRDIFAGVRVGVPLNDVAMLFAKGGYTNQRFSATYSLDDESETLSENLDGFRLGGGVEFDLGQPFARIEYRYSDYGSFSEADLETKRHQVMLTAGVRF
ncbi:outer membrane protein [Aurantiacibacter hainanensis]|uniref:outer membrane protein n=1 Tax=Aurantiacibacter hainanensis TaxID=3076114 RepID=UPI0030C739BB